MLSPTSLSGLSSGPNWTSPVRSVGPSRDAAAPLSPLAPTQRLAPNGGGQAGGGEMPSKTLPRGSLLDLSV